MYFLFLGGILNIKQVYAYEIVPIFPENQVRTDVVYYDLRMVPGQEQEVYLWINNTSKEPLNLTLSSVTAMTNDFGTVDYINDTAQPQLFWNQDLPFVFSDFVTLSDHVTILPYSSEYVPIQIKMPNQPFEGMVLGAIEILFDSEQDIPQKYSSISNQLRYLILMKLTESDNNIAKEVCIKQMEYFSDSNALLVTLDNMNGVYLFDFSLLVTLKNQQQEIVFKQQFDHLEMAPFSLFNFQIPLSDNLHSGETYQALIEIYLHDTEIQQQEYFSFKIPSDHFQKDMAQEGVHSLELYFKLFLIVILIIASFILILLKYRLLHKKEGEK